MSKKNEVAAIDVSNSEMAVFSDERPDWATGSGLGNEDVGIGDIILPRIDVLQALSPQIKKRDPKYIEGAEQGMVFNTVTGELYGSDITFIPVKFAREFIIWQDRKLGGGFRGVFPTEDAAMDELVKQEDHDTLEVVETHVHYILLVRPDGGLQEAVLSLSKSKRKVSRKLNTLAQMVGGDRFARAYKLSAVEAKSQKGEYWSFEVSPVGFVSKAYYDRAKETYNAIVAGDRKIDRSMDDSVVEADAVV